MRRPNLLTLNMLSLLLLAWTLSALAVVPMPNQEELQPLPEQRFDEDQKSKTNPLKEDLNNDGRVDIFDLVLA